jgi:hypothetical protein
MGVSLSIILSLEVAKTDFINYPYHTRRQLPHHETTVLLPLRMNMIPLTKIQINFNGRRGGRQSFEEIREWRGYVHRFEDNHRREEM